MPSFPFLFPIYDPTFFFLWIFENYEQTIKKFNQLSSLLIFTLHYFNNTICERKITDSFWPLNFDQIIRINIIPNDQKIQIYIWT